MLNIHSNLSLTFISIYVNIPIFRNIYLSGTSFYQRIEKGMLLLVKANLKAHSTAGHQMGLVVILLTFNTVCILTCTRSASVWFLTAREKEKERMHTVAESCV